MTLAINIIDWHGLSNEARHELRTANEEQGVMLY